MTTAKLKRRVVDRHPQTGERHRVRILHTVQSRRSNYDYELEYPPTVTDAQVVKDMKTLERMADEQADFQDVMDSLYNTTVSSSGLSATIGDAAIHIASPLVCKLLVRATTSKGFVFRKDYEAGTPSQLPSVGKVTADIAAFLDDLALD
jgi:hypothetical protein